MAVIISRRTVDTITEIGLAVLVVIALSAAFWMLVAAACSTFPQPY